MMVEILGTRLIAPHFGSSIYVWSSLITVTLSALAVGYWFGGFLADKKPRIQFLLWIVLLTGIFIAIIPLLIDLVVEGCIMLGLNIGAICSSIILFSPPLFLLGAVIPYVLRLQAHEFRKLGITAGKVYAISTLGGVCGTLLSGFYLIPNFSLRWTVSSLAIVLMLLAGIGWLLNRRVFPFLLSILISVLIVILTALGAAPPSGEIVYQTESFYGQLRIVDNKEMRILTIDGIPQTIVHKDAIESLYKGYSWEHQNFVELLPFYHPEGKNALLIGLGGGLDFRIMKLYDICCDAVEISPEVVDIARNYFGFDGTVAIQDGRHFVMACKGSYDFVIQDTFAGDVLPFHLMSQEMFKSVKNILTSNGIFLVNYIGYIKGEHSALTWSLYGTIRSVFENIHMYPVEMDDDLFNIRFFASDNELRLNEERMAAELSGIRYVDIYELKQSRIDYSQTSTTILTDDHNPSELWWAETSMTLRRKSSEFLSN